MIKGTLAIWSCHDQSFPGAFLTKNSLRKKQDNKITIDLIFMIKGTLAIGAFMIKVSLVLF